VIDLRQFFQTANPARTLDPRNSNDCKLYIDFSEVQGEQIIGEIKDLISFLQPDDPTCPLFTGHVGCGKSTELLRLRAELEQEGFHVVYFESTEDLEMANMDIGDVLLAMARRISQSLEKLRFKSSTGALQNILQDAYRILITEIEVAGAAEDMGFGASAITDARSRRSFEWSRLLLVPMLCVRMPPRGSASRY
jgi:hypothetical protein